MIHQSFRAEASLTLRPMQLRSVRQMILNTIDDPEEYPFIIHRKKHQSNPLILK